MGQFHKKINVGSVTNVTERAALLQHTSYTSCFITRKTHIKSELYLESEHYFRITSRSAVGNSAANCPLSKHSLSISYEKERM